MHHPSKATNRLMACLLWNTAVCMSSCFLVIPAKAHKTEVSGNVAGTWHVEPNHSPKAGQPAQVWVALTKQGGTIIPLDQCNCRLEIYQGSAANTEPLLKPPLRATSVENYQGIPGATVIFPQVGQYQLKLTGQPKEGTNFQAFNLSYTVTVGTGSSTTPSPVAPTSSTPQVNNSTTGNSTGETAPAADQPGIFGKSLIGLGAIALLIGFLRLVRQRSK